MLLLGHQMDTFFFSPLSLFLYDFSPALSRRTGGPTRPLKRRTRQLIMIVQPNEEKLCAAHFGIIIHIHTSFSFCYFSPSCFTIKIYKTLKWGQEFLSFLFFYFHWAEEVFLFVSTKVEIFSPVRYLLPGCGISSTCRAMCDGSRPHTLGK